MKPKLFQYKALLNLILVALCMLLFQTKDEQRLHTR